MAILLALAVLPGEVHAAQGSSDGLRRLDDPDHLLVMRGISVGLPGASEQDAIGTAKAFRPFGDLCEGAHTTARCWPPANAYLYIDYIH